MNRRRLLGFAIACIAALACMVGSPRVGQSAGQPSDIDAIKVAHAAFYAALSARDAKAMAAVWAKKPYVVIIGPRSKTAAVGYTDAVANYWPPTFERLPEISSTVTSIVQLRTDGKLAWVIGTEGVVIRRKDGKQLKYSAFFTDILEKDGGRWLMVSHHAHRIPK